MPRRPYRDSAIFYLVLAAIVVGVAWVTDGNVLRALIFGAAFFLVATGWSWWKFKQRIDRERVEAQRLAARGESGPKQ
jgi:membrane protein implicated in regulation of membrane protease activity